MTIPATQPDNAGGPTLKQLNRATLGAFLVALIILVVAVLPAEYGRDPTGIGTMLGLTPMGEMKAAEDHSDAVAAPVASVDTDTATLAVAPPAAQPVVDMAAVPIGEVAPVPAPVIAANAAAPAAPVAKSPVPAETLPAKPTAPAIQQGAVTLTLAPNEGREVKALMQAGDSFNYSWKTDGAEVRFEFHGEKTGAANGDFSSYEKGTSAGQSGSFEAPFDGTHGWYWRNRTENPVTITVTAAGTFQRFAVVQ
jgi:hypothetical protein